jgi:hypothetical protein
MRNSKVPVRFSTEKVIGFPGLIAIFKTVLPPDSWPGGEAESGAVLRILGLAKC